MRSHYICHRSIFMAKTALHAYQNINVKRPRWPIWPLLTRDAVAHESGQRGQVMLLDRFLAGQNDRCSTVTHTLKRDRVQI